MLSIEETKVFRKDKKKLTPNQKKKLASVLINLISQLPLDEKYKDHLLIGNYKDCRECHIEPDLLLIYKIEIPLLKLLRIGTHSNLFK